ncbi:MAG: hypothetical protein ACYDEH_03705 [Acidimicrobiales bacterium]
MTPRPGTFRYVGLDVEPTRLSAHYDLDGRTFTEVVAFEGTGDLTGESTRAIAVLWYLVAGLSYYKTAAPGRVDLGATPVGPRAIALLRAAIVDGLGEYAYRNALDLSDVDVVGTTAAAPASIELDPRRVLTPFGGGIDSIVTVETLADDLDQTLFVVSPDRGRFDALEAAAAVTGRPVVRATRSLDPSLLAGDPSFLRGHVPVTAMVTLLGALAAVASDRGGVVMSNEQSASVANLSWNGREVNHQWSKSWAAEVLIGEAVAEAVGPTLNVASFLRDRSELWVARRFSELTAYHHVFRSCNRAFAQDPAKRAAAWCGECDKCVFINLVLAPFLDRAALRAIFAGEPLADPARTDQLRTLVGLGEDHKPFECVGDPDESAQALRLVAARDDWRNVRVVTETLAALGALDIATDPFAASGPSRAPAHWLR